MASRCHVLTLAAGVLSCPVPMTDPELRALRRRLDSIPRGRGRRIPVELRMQVTAWVAKHRKRGDSWSELVRKTGVSMLARIRLTRASTAAWPPMTACANSGSCGTRQ
jgi:hypothetical protein